jgi:hypothetical protein
MDFELIDLETGTPYGPYASHAEAKKHAADLKGFVIYNGGTIVELHDPLNFGLPKIGVPF